MRVSLSPGGGQVCELVLCWSCRCFAGVLLQSVLSEVFYSAAGKPESCLHQSLSKALHTDFCATSAKFHSMPPKMSSFSKDLYTVLHIKKTVGRALALIKIGQI